MSLEDKHKKSHDLWEQVPESAKKHTETPHIGYVQEKIAGIKATIKGMIHPSDSKIEEDNGSMFTRGVRTNVGILNPSTFMTHETKITQFDMDSAVFRENVLDSLRHRVYESLQYGGENITYTDLLNLDSADIVNAARDLGVSEYWHNDKLIFR